MSYFKSDGQYIYADTQCVEFYIPKYYFEKSSNFAEDCGSVIKALGVFDIGILVGGQVKEMRVLNLPTTIELYVVDSEDRDVKLPGEEEMTACLVLRYTKGQKIMRSSIVQDSSNVESYLNFVNKGKVPSIVPYEKSLQLWRKNQELNGANLTENACRLVLNDKVYKRFVYYYTLLNSFKERLKQLTKTGSQPKLAITRLATAEITYPDIEEQKEIVKLLDLIIIKLDKLQSNYYFNRNQWFW